MLLEEFEKSISPVTSRSYSWGIMDKILNEEPGKLPDVLSVIKSALPKNLNNIDRTCNIGSMLSVIMRRFPEEKLTTWEVFKEFYRQQSDKKEQVRLLFYANENLWEHTVTGGKFLQTDNVTTKMSNDLMEMMSNSNFSAEELKSELWPTSSLRMILHYTPKHAAQVVSLLEKAFAPQKLNEDTWMLKDLTNDILEANPKLADRLIKSGFSKDFINKKITDLKAEGRFKEEAKPVQTEIIDHEIEKVRKRIENPRLSGVVIADKIVEDMKKGVVITPDKGRELAAKYKRQYALDKKQNSKSL